MAQYHEIKSRYSGAILFFRLGDFYEMFGEDAQNASKILDLVLTRRGGYPMCGVPHHSVNSYLRKLIKAGRKVAVCEQLEEPGLKKGIVRRDVVRVITPGTILEDNLLEAKENNFLLSLYPDEKNGIYGIAFHDVSTGEFYSSEILRDNLRDELARILPSEILVPERIKDNPAILKAARELELPVTAFEDFNFFYTQAESKLKNYFKVISLKAYGLEGHESSVSACGALLSYVEKSQGKSLVTLDKIEFLTNSGRMQLDETVIRNLELVEGIASRSKENSLLEVIDCTLTSMGARLIRRKILEPLVEINPINERLDAVEYFINDGIARRGIREKLKSISDLERIVSRISMGSASPREIIALKNSLEIVPEIDKIINAGAEIIDKPGGICRLSKNFVVPAELLTLISASMNQEPPVNIKDGGVIKDGFSAELDELRAISKGGKKLISEIEDKERKASGINSLKVGYTSVFGYYIEVTKSNIAQVPANYVRKQTLTNCERFITDELKTLEEKILSSEDKIIKLESRLFEKVKSDILAYSGNILELSHSIAEIDFYCSLSETAVLSNYTRPVVDEGFVIDIKDGRHPVVERIVKSGTFVPNDTRLDSSGGAVIILTGPNMAGKSTYIRQVALISILAQIGSYVPAQSAKIGIVDKIFTRIGAHDNLAGGESTFMVEMHETAKILHGFTQRSLLILDEIGRGTSTYDGISIARATLEYLAGNDSKNVFPRTLFATHYFELTDLSEKIDAVKNFNVSVKEWEGDVVFLHKIVPGSADRSYGIHVAKLAGMPGKVIARARSILHELEGRLNLGRTEQIDDQLDFFSVRNSKVLTLLAKIDINSMTPLEAIGFLNELKREAEQEQKI